MLLFRSQSLAVALLSTLTAFLTACTGGTPETPGDQSSPVLATLLQKALEAEIARMNPVWAPGLLPSAPKTAREWLMTVDEVVARCRYGPGNRTKGNRLEYDLRLHSGEQVLGIQSGQRCLYGFAPPLVMRVRLEDGQVRDAQTDGRERQSPVDAISPEVQQFARSLIRADWKRRPGLYFPPEKSAEDIAREWAQPPAK